MIPHHNDMQQRLLGCIGNDPEPCGQKKHIWIERRTCIEHCDIIAWRQCLGLLKPNLAWDVNVKQVHLKTFCCELIRCGPCQ
jgi:hypothetical protein